MGNRRRSKQPHKRHLRQLSTAHSFLPRGRADASPPRLPQPRVRNGTHPPANTAWSERGPWGTQPGTRGSRALGCAGRKTLLFHFSSQHGDGGSVGPYSAPSAPCPDHSADRCPRAEAKGLAGVRGPFHSRFSFPWHAGCRAPVRGAELPGQPPLGPLLQEPFISEAVIRLGCSSACRREQQ